MEAEYIKNNDGVWWCNSHQRKAEYISLKEGYLIHNEHCCNPRLGGILLPCNCIEITNLVEIE